VSHPEQRDFCQRIRARWPHLFENKSVLDCGSLDVNGNNRFLFTGGSYQGLDLIAGPNVDIVSRIHEYQGGPFDVVISTEALEHDRHLDQSLDRMAELVAPGGILLVTCATTGRPEHGTTRCDDWASPGTTDFYRNVLPQDLVPLVSKFRCWGIEVTHSDLYCWALDRR